MGRSRKEIKTQRGMMASTRKFSDTNEVLKLDESVNTSSCNSPIQGLSSVCLDAPGWDNCSWADSPENEESELVSDITSTEHEQPTIIDKPVTSCTSLPSAQTDDKDYRAECLSEDGRIPRPEGDETVSDGTATGNEPSMYKVESTQSDTVLQSSLSAPKGEATTEVINTVNTNKVSKALTELKTDLLRMEKHVSNLRAVLMEEENKTQTSHTKNKKPEQRTLWCEHCRRTGHQKKDCRARKQAQNYRADKRGPRLPLQWHMTNYSNSFCYFCGQWGHLQENCKQTIVPRRHYRY